MSIQHELITDPKIHEPKGASTASVDTVYAANGSGSGTWKKVGTANIDLTALDAHIQSVIDDGTLDIPADYYIQTRLDDVSTAGSRIMALPDSCTIVKGTFVLGGPITTADVTITVKNAAGVDMGTAVVIPFTSSAKGQVFNFTATGNNVLTGPTWFEIITDGASGGVAPLVATFRVEKLLLA